MGIADRLFDPFLSTTTGKQKAILVKLFECQTCGNVLYFENTQCVRCKSRLAYAPDAASLTVIHFDGPKVRAAIDPGRSYRLCANFDSGVCNWLVAEADFSFCLACRHNRTIPDLRDPANLPRWRKVEDAKHRLFYSILRLGLPHPTRGEDPRGLVFDFLAEDAEDQSRPHVLTGHDNGLITLALAEADDDVREQRRVMMGEPYRTLIGHFRHEICHFYWDQLIAPNRSAVAEFRELFGDEREDYAASLQRHYSHGAPQNWSDNFVSSYASAHPWEDFAETGAHLFHMIDTLETARSFGVRTDPRIGRKHEFSSVVDFDPYASTIEHLTETWLPFTFAMNAINQSMGTPSLYPFILSEPAVRKLSYLHGCFVQARRGDGA